jgi:signal transduction histidine kinase
MQLLRTHPDRPLIGPDVSAWLFAGQSLVGIGFVAAAVLAYRVYRRDRLGVDGCLAIGLVLAAFSQLHSALHPGSYTGVVTTGDALRVAFYGSLLVAVVVEGWTDVRELRLAHATIRQLHEAELVRATYEERARLAREIHDGLAQDLWYAKLKQDRLMALVPADSEIRGLGVEVADALDVALADARQAVMALRASEGGSFGEVLLRYVEDFGDRFGILTDCSIEPIPAEPTARAQAEVLRIVQEALNNVRKHADATVVHVTAHVVANGIEVTVADNGRGFDPSRAGGGYGLHGMQERARIARATFSVDSRPSDGTRVRVVVPAARSR